MKDSDSKVPGQKELEKELNEYLGKKYGDRIRLVVPMLFPKPQAEEVSKEEKELAEGKKKKIHCDLKPEECEAFLNDYIIRQDDAKEILATKVCTHFNRIKFTEMTKGRDPEPGVGSIKNNIILIGPTGVGKTYLVKLIAKKIGVPFVKGDATKFSETGYVGGDVEDLVRDLVYEADGDMEMAQYGIIYIDEIDKIASSNHTIGPDVSRTGVQRALLKPMEETEVDLKVPHDPISQLEAIEHYRRTGKKEKRTINTKHILFIMSGAFNRLEEMVKKLLAREGIGFRGKKKDFKFYGMYIQCEEDALYEVAVRSYEEKTGARGLVSAVEKVLLKFEKRLPSTDIRKFVVARELVLDPDHELERLLDAPRNPEMLARLEALLSEEKTSLKQSILNREGEFQKRYGIFFPESRINLIVDRIVEKGHDVNTVFEEVVEIQRLVENFEKDFYRRNGIRIRFSEEAIDRITKIALDEDGKGGAICSRLWRG